MRRQSVLFRGIRATCGKALPVLLEVSNPSPLSQGLLKSYYKRAYKDVCWVSLTMQLICGYFGGLYLGNAVFDMHLWNIIGP